MKREEEIEKVSVYHLSQYDYSYEEGEHLDLYIKGFTDGAKWADEHLNLSSLWHDASEEPQSNHKNIIYQTNYHSMYNVHIDFIPTCLRSCKITSRSWDEFVKEVNMRRWAYISDLLPKS